MTSLDPKIATTQEDGENLEKEESAPPQKKGTNQRDQTQGDEKKGKTTASDGDLLDVKSTLSLPTWKTLADSNNATTAEGKSQRNEITVKSKDIDGGITKCKSDVGSEPFNLKSGLRNKASGGIETELDRPTKRCRLQSGEVITKNEWIEIRTFNLPGKGEGGGGGGGGGSTVGGSGGNGGGTGGQQG